MNNIELVQQIETLRVMETMAREERQALELQLRNQVYAKYLEEKK